MRYVLGLRGPQLVFQPHEIAHWQSKRALLGAAHTKMNTKPRPRRTRIQPGRAPNVESLLLAVEEMSATIALLSRRLAEQESRLDKTHSLLAELTLRGEARPPAI
jgi:hypothetical protein